MKLTLQYLKDQHSYWRQKIGEAGIWDPDAFGQVFIVIRPDCRSYNGMFIRKKVKLNGKSCLVDRIFIYDKAEDFDRKFLDSVLVHEMIHQYIIQNNIKDSSSHGRIFRSFMQKINSKFPDELSIGIRANNPSVKKSGAGNKTHILLIIKMDDGFSYCAVVSPGKVSYFNQLLKKNPHDLKIREFRWAVSNDVYFRQCVRCVKNLHGIKKPWAEMDEFCKEHDVVFTPSQ